jgi:hypothetical protein
VGQEYEKTFSSPDNFVWTEEFFNSWVEIVVYTADKDEPNLDWNICLQQPASKWAKQTLRPGIPSPTQVVWKTESEIITVNILKKNCMLINRCSCEWQETGMCVEHNSPCSLSNKITVNCLLRLPTPRLHTSWAHRPSLLVIMVVGVR